MKNSQIPNIVKKILPAVVSITVSKYLTIVESPFGPQARGPLPFGNEGFFVVPKGKKKVQIGGGSGFIVNPNGIILTNRHVVSDPKAEYTVVLDENKKYLAEVVAKDPINDIAIIKIKAKNLSVIQLGDSSSLELAQTVVAVGDALGTFRNTVSVGVISGLSRVISAGDTLNGEITKLRGLVQTDAAINPGNSGGPLVDEEGKAIGINAAIVLGAENIGFALPINAAKKDLQDVKKYGRIRQPFLGLRYVILNKELQKGHKLPVNHGALVVSEPIPDGKAIFPGGAAQKAGIKEKDIILECQREKICEEKTLQDILQKFTVGDTVNLKILRNGKKKIFKLILGEKK